MGPAIVTALDDIESMLTLPKGCGEQNMMRLAPLVFVTEFRKAIQQLDVPTEKRAKDHIMMGMHRTPNAHVIVVNPCIYCEQVIITEAKILRLYTAA